MNLPASNFPLQCRTCLTQSSNTISIFNTERFAEIIFPIYEAIMTCAPVQISIGDGFPDRVCLGCMDELRRAFVFRKRCEKSEETLKSARILSADDCPGNDSSKHEGVDNKSGILEKDRNDKNQKNVEKSDETSSKLVNQKRPIAIDVYTEIFECEKCKKRFISKRGLELHTAEYHNPESSLPKKCTICNRTFRYPSSLVNHMVVHTGEKPFLCNTCGKSFSQLSYLRLHNYTHTGEKPYQCQICDKSYATPTLLKTHVRKHTGELPYACDVCGKRFLQSGSVRLHARTHTGEKPYGCRLCEQRFAQSCHLKNHMRTHSGEQPYTCNMCDRSFSLRDVLKKHLRTHTGERPYSCDLCGKTFTQSGSLHTHMKIHNDDLRNNKGKHL